MSRVIARCEQLATITDSPGSITRIYLSPAYMQGLALVAEWMQQAGMTTWVDAAGNQWGRFACANPDAPTLIIGSHLDTVPNAGKFDGILGVVTGIEVVERLVQTGKTLPFHLEVVGFGDEEGLRFEASMLGSRAAIGKWEDALLELTDAQGMTLEKALLECGLNPHDYPKADRSKDNLLGFWEVHMEQGPVLEVENLPVGVVSAIAGARRFKVMVEGEFGHAGTVPMMLRQDALAATAEIILMIEKNAQIHGLVATVGHIKAYPNAVNVIPGMVEFTVDIRSDDDALREKVMNLMFHSSEAISMQRGLDIYWKEYHWAPARACHVDFRQLFEQSISEQKVHVKTLVSGAGHDAMNMASITDIGMIFVRCKGGISHNPAESVEPEDADLAVETVLLALDKLAICYLEKQGVTP
ncbi:allantoate amidohydrolase [Thiosulfativibrio zosterae]|uniref:Zn-dependent hydrolase n=1 Tax=Thiosulfativibrio zosterae TaxID=2675053 RepID=A0A6F8PPI9_9GAMM|nr:allantoate amidohydrolase [Thiosulfativibrio zosterae]BBP43910.1 Zn-dependent hydrolase [Thiosulfativibrio zosterae]